MDEKKIQVEHDAERDAWKGFFEHKGKHYLADLVIVHDYHRPEIMIFKADKKGEVKDYTELYAAYPEKVDKETLIQHIQIFTAEPTKTLKGWHESGARTWDEYCQPGDEIDEEAYNDFLDVLPPHTLKRCYFQVGEPTDTKQDKNGKWRDTWPTFAREGGRYYYLGNCFTGERENVV